MIQSGYFQQLPAVNFSVFGLLKKSFREICTFSFSFSLFLLLLEKHIYFCIWDISVAVPVSVIISVSTEGARSPSIFP